MSMKMPMPSSTADCSAALHKADALIQAAESIVIGAGAGLSAAGGLNYADPALAQRWFPEYVAKGYATLLDIQGLYWYQAACRLESYWGYWARHIAHIRYETPLLAPYRDLYTLSRGKAVFIITTNVDGQMEKAGFDPAQIFAPQGDYALFQCSRRCSDEVYDNRDQIERMIAHMPTPTDIRTEDIPYCPRCGAPLCPNLRCDHRFAEERHMRRLPAYEQFLHDADGGRLLLLELGVGYNTPGIIRFPFEEMVRARPAWTLVRINRDDADVPADLGGRAVGVRMDLADALQALCGGLD